MRSVWRQRSHAVLNPLRDLRKRHARFDPPLRPLPHLSVHFRTTSVVGQEILVHAVEVSFLLAGGAEVVLIAVLAYLALGVCVVGE